MQQPKRHLWVRVMLVLALALSAVSLTGCFPPYSPQEIIDMIRSWAEHKGLETLESEETQDGQVTLALTFPAGASPNVFTSGWVFGARCTVQTDDGVIDYSDKVEWSGTGSFSPAQGRTSRPTFGGPGANQITLTVNLDDRVVEKTFTVQAVSPGGYASVGSLARCDADGHGCPACPHATSGPVTTGSPVVFIGGKSAARVGDTGVHAACCGQNTFEITSGDSSVLIGGRPAATLGSTTSHCGGVGEIVTVGGG